MNTDELRAWVKAHLTPLLVAGLAIMPVNELFGVLLGAAIPYARRAGLTDDEIRAALDRVLSQR